MHEIEVWLKRFKKRSSEKFLILNVHPSLGEKLKEGKIKRITKLQFKYFVKIKLNVQEAYSPASFQFISAKTGKDLTQEFMS
jgi:hypothetical protein